MSVANDIFHVGEKLGDLFMSRLCIQLNLEIFCRKLQQFAMLLLLLEAKSQDVSPLVNFNCGETFGYKDDLPPSLSSPSKIKNLNIT